MIELMQGDCLERMEEIPDGSVDMICSDPPYGTTVCKWDSIIPLEPMWEQLKRVIKPNGAIVMTASQPFTTTLISSNMKMFKYCWYFRKGRASGFVNAKLKPLKDIEDICVFSEGATANGSKRNMPYYPQNLVETNKTWRRPKQYKTHSGVSPHRDSHKLNRIIKHEGYPRQVLDFSIHNVGLLHPTQKPVALMEYLIKTYTKEGEIVLDFCIGSGTTMVAAKNLNRRGIGIEKDETYFNLAEERIENHVVQIDLERND